MLLNVYKDLTKELKFLDLTDGLDSPTIARQFVDANERRRHFSGTVHSPLWNPPEQLGLTLGTLRLELFGNLPTCILLYYTNDYCIWLYFAWLADTRLAPINELLITFVYSLLLLFIAYIADFVMCYCATVSLSIHVFGQASTCRITGIWHPWLDYTCRCINWLLTYFEMSRHTRHYFSAWSWL